jgi:hypothetical protein
MRVEKFGVVEGEMAIVRAIYMGEKYKKYYIKR